MASVFCALALKKASISTIATPLLTKLLRRPNKTPSSSVISSLARSRSFSSSFLDQSAAVIIETDMDKSDYYTLMKVDQNGLTYEFTGDDSEKHAALKAGMPYTQLYIVRRLGVVKLVKEFTYQEDSDGMKIKMKTVYENW